MKERRIFFVLMLLLALQNHIFSNDLQPQNPFPGATTGLHFIGQTFFPSVDIYFYWNYAVNANEWYVSVDIFHGVEKVYSSTIPGVDRNTSGEIIGSLPLTASVPFTPTAGGSYSILFEVYYQYDINRLNDYVSADFQIYGLPEQVMGPSPPPGSTIEFSPAQSFMWGNGTSPITDSHVILSPVYPSAGDVFSANLSNPTATTWAPPNNLEPQTEYGFEIYQSNPAGTTRNGPYSYTTEDEPCAPRVDIIYPEDGAADLPVDPTDLMWTESENSSAESYSVYLSPELSGIDPSLVDPLTVTSPGHTSIPIPWDLIQPGTTLHARIGANCPDGSSYSDVSSFTFSDESWPDPPQVLIPVNGSTVPFDPFIPVHISAPHPSPDGEISTEIWLGTSQSDVSPETAAPVTMTVDVSKTEFNLPGPFETDQEYFVRAVYICGDEPNTFQKLGDITQFFTSGASDISGTINKTYAPNSSLVDVNPSLFDVEGNVEVVLPNGSTENVKKTIKPDSNGDFLIPELPPGDYTLQLITPPQWTYLTPSSGMYQGILESGQNIIDRNFIVIPPPSVVTGEKWQDDNPDGEKDDNESGVPNWQITLGGTSFAGDAVNMSTVTDAEGIYIFTNVSPGNYTVTEATVEGWRPTYPSSVVHEFPVDDGNPVNNLNFGNYPMGGSISGRKFFDENKNSVFDINELGLNNWTIQLYYGGQLIAEEQTTAIDINGDEKLDPRTEFGWYSFTNLSPGTYIIKEVEKDGWELKVPNNNQHTIPVSAGELIHDINFGNYFEFLDWGDLPEPADSIFGACPPGDQCYETLPPLGARHAAVGAKLGQLRDAEPIGIPSDFANGDDTTGVDDEDGVEFLKFLPGISGEVEVTVTGDPADFPTFLAAWIDFNGNGQFEPIEGELIISDVINAAGTYQYTFPVPELILGAGYARFRLGTDLLLLFGPIWFGISQDGEVEDYVGLGFDYGDANRQIDNDHPYFPYGYPVQLIDDGARHIATPTTLLGSVLTDSENDGQPDIFAASDDINNRADEDGIQLIDGYQIVYSGPNPNVPNKNLTIIGFTQGTDVSLKPLATRTGYLNLWVDYNGDGHWDNLDEQVFDDEPILPGPDYTLLTFTVPDDAKIGWTYARFRYSTVTNLEITGPAKDGEVEDYLIAILPPIDFGDSPEPYPTLFADNGAFHILSDWYLGESVDAEFDGLPHPDAFGDDLDNLNDEDGIIFLDELTSGTQASIEVKSNVPTGESGYLSAWIDFDQSSSWETLEQVTVDVELFGGIDTLTISIPGNASPGETFARFRFSNQTGLVPTETFLFPAEINVNPGEVEDYKVTIDTLITSIGNDLDYIPQEFNLYQNYPNPFNPSTIIRYDVKEVSHVKLDVYNILGQLVTTLVNKVQSAGAYEAKFETDNLSAGIYFYSIRMSNYVKTMKMILMK